MKGKWVLVLGFILLLLGGVTAQDCEGIREQVKKAIRGDRLDEALEQVKALRACDGSATGKQEADEWTEQIFQRIKALELSFRQAQQKMISTAQNAQQKKEQAQTALKNLEYEKNQLLLAQQKLIEESVKAQSAIVEKNKAIQFNELLAEINAQQLLGQQKVNEKQYAEAILIFQTAIDRILAEPMEDESLDYKLIALQNDLAKTRVLFNNRQIFDKILVKGDSLIAHHPNDYFAIYKLYQQANALKVDSLSILSRFSQLENSWSKKNLRQLNGAWYDSTLIASAEVNANLNNVRRMKMRLDKFMALSPRDLPNTRHAATANYLYKNNPSILHRFEIGTSIKTFYINPQAGHQTVDVSYKGEKASFKHAHWYLPFAFHLTYHLDKKNSLNAIATTGKPNLTKSYQTNNIFFDDNLSTYGTISLQYQHTFWEVYRRHFNSQLLSFKWILGVTYNGYTKNASFNVRFGEESSNPFEAISLPEPILDKEFKPLDYSYNKKIYHWGSSYVYSNLVGGFRADYQLFRIIPVKVFSVADYNFTLDRASNIVTIYPAKEIYNRLISFYGYKIPDDKKQELYNYYQTCDCEFSYEGNPKRFTTGFTFSLGLSYRF